jgi:hypothetical protein
METIINIIGGASGWGICWLINKILERNFCKKAGKDANHNYIELQKAKKNK